MIGCFRPRRHSKLASEEELDRAAQYVVARFGAYDNEEESDEEEEGAEELEGKVSSSSVTEICLTAGNNKSELMLNPAVVLKGR